MYVVGFYSVFVDGSLLTRALKSPLVLRRLLRKLYNFERFRRKCGPRDEHKRLLDIIIADFMLYLYISFTKSYDFELCGRKRLASSVSGVWVNYLALNKAPYAKISEIALTFQAHMNKKSNL